MKISFAMQFSRSLLLMTALSFIPSTVPRSFAQEADKPKAWFSLKISDYRHDWFGTYRLRIEVTNISNEPHHIPDCAVFRGLYTTSVKFNGVLLQEKDTMERRQREAEWRRTSCNSQVTSSKAPPGYSHEDFLTIGQRYDMSNPGIYEIVLALETDPDHPEKSTTVQSNTLIIKVGDPPR